MKSLIVLTLIFSSSYILTAQNDYKEKLADDITRLTASIETSPGVQDYVKRAEAIFMLNSVDPDQTLVTFRLPDALADMNAAISLDSENAHLYSLRAELKRDINRDYKGAIADIDIALHLNPHNADLYLQRANYQKLSQGCFDYRKCAKFGDRRCEKIVKEVCM